MYDNTFVFFQNGTRVTLEGSTPTQDMDTAIADAVVMQKATGINTRVVRSKTTGGLLLLATAIPNGVMYNLRDADKGFHDWTVRKAWRQDLKDNSRLAWNQQQFRDELHLAGMAREYAAAGINVEVIA